MQGRHGSRIRLSSFAAYDPCVRLWQRISQKLLRNIQKFLELIYIELGCQRMKEIRINMEEIVLQGDEGVQDVRTVNSYPSKVCATASSSQSRAARVILRLPP
jgi:hypothetical protein